MSDEKGSLFVVFSLFMIVSERETISYFIPRQTIFRERKAHTEL